MTKDDIDWNLIVQTLRAQEETCNSGDPLDRWTAGQIRAQIRNIQTFLEGDSGDPPEPPQPTVPLGEWMLQEEDNVPRPTTRAELRGLITFLREIKSVPEGDDR